MQKEGQIKVSSENIFPIIKKWLYSDKDIFLREIVANACDAIKKYQSLCSIGEAENDGIKPRIEIIADKNAKTLTVTDNGIGMTADEVEKYITQIAFSGAEEFIEKYKDKSDDNAGIIVTSDSVSTRLIWFLKALRLKHFHISQIHSCTLGK